MKSFGASIFSSVCQAQPFSDRRSGFRESFDLVKVGDVWCCEEHRPPKPKRAPRVAAATPAEAINEFERTLAAQTAHLEDAVADCNDDDVASVLKEYGEEVGRALDELKRVIAAQKPPPAEKEAGVKRTCQGRSARSNGIATARTIFSQTRRKRAGRDGQAH